MLNSTPQRTDAPRSIALLNQKGGVGKTTTTVNLGAALAEAGQRVLMIDLDPQAHLTLHLGIEDDQIDGTVYDLLIDPDCSAGDIIIAARENLDVILAEVDLAGAEPELAGAVDRQGILRRKIAPIAGRYDFVLMDCPPSLGLLTLNALSVAREVIVPMQAHFLALQGVGKLLETVGLVCRTVNPDLLVKGIILCMHEGHTTLAKEVVTDLDEFFEAARGSDLPWSQCEIFRPFVRRNIKLAEAPSFGQTIFDYAPWCRGAIDYRKLAERIRREHEPVRIEVSATHSFATAPPPAPSASEGSPTLPTPTSSTREWDGHKMMIPADTDATTTDSVETRLVGGLSFGGASGPETPAATVEVKPAAPLETISQRDDLPAHATACAAD